MSIEAFKELIEDFAKDTSKENDGVWMTFKRHDFLIARSHRDNVKFFRLMEERMRPYRHLLARGNYEAIKDKSEELMQEVYAETVLLGIRNSATQEPLPYSPADGVALFKRLPDLWDEVFKFSGQDGNYSPDEIQAESKN